MTDMDTTKLETIRSALLRRRDEVQAEIDRLGQELQWFGSDDQSDMAGVGNHLADEGSNVFEQERISTVVADFEDVLAQVNAALDRMDDGTYGVCQRCGKPINQERLEAFPHVAFCIDCQTLIERENALRSGY